MCAVEEIRVKLIECTLQKAAIALGDTLVLNYPGHISQEHMARLRAQLTERFPANTVLVIEGGATLEVRPSKD